MKKTISKLLLHLFGWKTTGHYPREIKKMIIVVAPHTSNWDFILSLLIREAMEMEAYFIAKAEIFRPPWGTLFRWLGGYPVNRIKSQNFVQSVASIFNSSEKFIITMAPEGTRSKVKRFKTGFYYMALHAKVPVLLAGFDYKNRIVDFGPLIYPSGNISEDMNKIYSYFNNFEGKHPEKGIHVERYEDVHI